MKMIVAKENFYASVDNITVQYQAKNIIMKLKKINIFLRDLKNLI